MGSGASKKSRVKQTNERDVVQEEFIKETSQRIVLITGCSTGIGLSIAVLLASDEQKRFKVYATMRNLSIKQDLEEAAKDVLGELLFVKELDVCVEESVKIVVKEILDKEQRIDILGKIDN